jgi:arylsulfatase A-like enzyme
VDTLEEAAITNESVITEGVLAQSGYATWHFGRWHIGKRQWLDCYEGRLEKAVTDEYWDEVLPGEIEKLRQEQPVIDLADVGQYAEIPDLKKGVEKWRHTVVMTEAMREAHKRWQESPKAKYPILSLVGRSIVPPEHHEEALLADEVIDVINNAKRNEPFMITWSVSPPHDPVVTMEPYYSMVPRTETLLPQNANSLPESLGDTSQDFVETAGKDAELECIAVYLGMVKYVDDQVGRILDALDKAGLTKDTLVVFTADHGDMLGAHGMLYKSTRCMYDETTRVPLIMRYPRSLPAGRRVQTPLSLVDMMPTLLDYAGEQVPVAVDGASMRPLLEGTTDKSPHTVVVENWAGRMVRDGSWKYAWYDTGDEWLFDLAADSGETKNLIKDPAHAADASRMRQLLIAEMKRTSDAMADKVGKS